MPVTLDASDARVKIRLMKHGILVTAVSAAVLAWVGSASACGGEGEKKEESALCGGEGEKKEESALCGGEGEKKEESALCGGEGEKKEESAL